MTKMWQIIKAIEEGLPTYYINKLEIRLRCGTSDEGVLAWEADRKPLAGSFLYVPGVGVNQFGANALQAKLFELLGNIKAEE